MKAASDGGWIGVLAATLAMQVCSSFMNRIAPTLGPPISAAAGIDESMIGYLAAVGTIGSILFFFAGSAFLRRLGSIRSLQWGMVLGAAGAALLMLPYWPLLLLSSLLVGFGYGPSAPAGSDALQRYAPARHRNLLFSIKQAGVPIGGVLAGLLLPAIHDAGGMVLVSLLAVGFALVVSLLVQPLRAAVDATRDPRQSVGFGAIFDRANLLRPLAIIAEAREHRRLGWAGACLAVGQGAWFAFLVTYLALDIGLSLAMAGLVFAAMQGAGIGGRIVLGWLADRLGSGVRVLRAMAIASALCSLALALVQPGWSIGAILAVAIGAGLSVSAWNGVQVAEIARRAPPDRIADFCSGATMLVFVGYVLGPAGFALIQYATGSFRIAFLLVAATTALAFVLLTGAEGGRRTAG